MERHSFVTRMHSAFDRILGDQGKIALSVSGGGDSMALLALFSDWAKTRKRPYAVLSVNHHLRKEADAELECVAQRCASLGVSHTILDWMDWDGTGNLQDHARKARYHLIGKKACELDCLTVATGHTMNDQAETFLMRLARGSGVDGLSGMRVRVHRDGILWTRPLLTESRSTLRDYLELVGWDWAEDPSNQDTQFARIRFRQAAETLKELGLTAERLAKTARQMQRARAALDKATYDFAKSVATPTPAGSVLLDCAGFSASEPEIQLRLLAHCLGWVSCEPYKPRLASLERVRECVLAAETRTLSGCLVLPGKTGTMEVVRELKAIILPQNEGSLYDGRWRQMAPGQLRPLGSDGLILCGDWQKTGLSKAALMSSPSLWTGDELLAAPGAGLNDAAIVLDQGVEFFYSSIITH